MKRIQLEITLGIIVVLLTSVLIIMYGLGESERLEANAKAPRRAKSRWGQRFSTNGIVGASVPMCAGYALRNQIKNDGRVTISYFGEGGSNQGGIQETLNLAACWNLPIVFICENSSPVIQRMFGHEMDYPQLTIEDVSIRAAGYGIPGSTHDGWDVEEVYRVAGEAIDRARAGKGPTLLEFKVHQFEGNLEGRLEANEKDKPFCPIDVLEHKLRIEQILKKDIEETRWYSSSR